MTIDWISWVHDQALRDWSPATWGSAGAPRDLWAGCDIHLLAGTSARALVREITYNQRVGESSTQYLAHHDYPKEQGATVRFALQLAAGKLKTTAKVMAGLGVNVHTETGVVSADKNFTGTRVRNLFVQAIGSAKDAAGTVKDLTSTLRIRVHVHDKLEGTPWLTPSLLTIRRGAPGQRFTLLAEMSSAGHNGPPLIGDLSRMDGVTWSASDASVTVGGNGAITATKLGRFTVKAKLPVDWGGGTATGEIEVVEGWHEQPTARHAARLLAGPGSARLAEVPNILFIPEGFTADQEQDWWDLVTDAAADLANHRIGRPFDLLVAKGAINIWSVFFPSRQPGSSALYELHQVPGIQPNSTIGDPLPLSRIFQPSAGNSWDVGGLFGAVGLPMRGDAAPAAHDDRIKAHDAKVTAWNDMFGGVTKVNARFDQWLLWTEWSTRTLADERDTALGLAFGSRPKLHGANPDRAVLYHPFRTQRADLDTFLAKITDDGAPIIGHVWVPPKTGGEVGPPLGAGKDRSYVVAIVGGGRWGGAESTHEVATATASSNGTLPLEKIGSNLRCGVLPHPLPRGWLDRAKLWDLELGTIVHDLGHAFGLQDEYTDFEKTGGILGLTARDARASRAVPNVQAITDLQDPAQAPATRVGDGLIGDRLKWRWPRIARAAVVVGGPVKSGTDEYVLPLRLGEKLKFRRGTIVYLRQRPLRRIEREGKDDTLKFVLRSALVVGPLTVTSDLQVGEQIVVHAPGGLDEKAFTRPPPFESIVFVPVPPPPDAAAANEKFAELVPLVVRKHITQLGLPLNRASGTCQALGMPRIGFPNPREELKNLPKNVSFSWHHEWVGAFDGGMRNGCGIYHPSRSCAMNHLQVANPGGVRAHLTLGPFCPVCSYVLADVIDPALHGDIDALYAPFYVEVAP
jgi:hypothetical protein